MKKPIIALFCTTALLAVSFSTQAQQVTSRRILPQNVQTYIHERQQCNQARDALILPQTQSKQNTDTLRRQAQSFCLGKDTQYKNLTNQYKNNPRILQELAMVNDMGDILIMEAPIQFGQTIDALMPEDIVKHLQRVGECMHFAGEFSGDGSKEDKRITKTMNTLKCDKIGGLLSELEKKHQNNADAVQFIRFLREHF